jgi:hypothetical protein
VESEAQRRISPPTDEVSRELKSLSYINFANVKESDRGKTGVTLYNADRAYDGVNVLFRAAGCDYIEFLDMRGRSLHRIDVRDLPKSKCQSLKLTADGLFLLAKPNLFKLNNRGDLVWMVKGGRSFHHDFDQGFGGLIALTYKNAAIELAGVKHTFRDNHLVAISEHGEVIDRLSLFALFKDDVVKLARQLQEGQFSESTVKRIAIDSPRDLVHANTVEILARDIGVGRPGDLLISIRSIDTIAVINVEKKRVLWKWGPGELDRPHHPTVLKNGNILVFDNGWRRGYSRVIELNPRSESIVWEFKGSPPSSFFTQKRGGAYAFPNDNILITESNNGRAFEVTREGEIVWEYWMPFKSPNNQRYIPFRVQRIEHDDFAARFRARR